MTAVKSIIDVTEALEARPQQMGDDFLCNGLQKALWELMKEELSRRLSISVQKERKYWEGPTLRVTLYLDSEAISSDYVSIPEGE